MAVGKRGSRGVEGARWVSTASADEVHGESPGLDPRSDLLRSAGNAEILAALARPEAGISSLIVADLALSAAGIAQHAFRTNGAAAAAVSAASAPLLRQARGEALDTDAAIQAALRSHGAPLPGPLAARMSAALGHDLSGVRVHLDSAAAEAADQAGARAFAMGRDVYFSAGAFAPGTAAGDHLLAHELAHVVQSDRGQLPAGRGVSSPSDGVEAQADAMANRALSAPPVAFTPLPAAASSPSSAAVAGPILRSEEGEAAPAAPTEADAADLAQRCREADATTAGQVLAALRAEADLPAKVAELDRDDALATLLQVAGEPAYSDPAVLADLLAVMEHRAADKNLATLKAHLNLPANANRKISTAHAAKIYQMLKALPEAQRTALLATEEGQHAFALMDSCSTVELRMQSDFGFYDSDYGALLAELEDLATWDPAQALHLRTVFWMLVRAGFAADPTVVLFVQHNWSANPSFFSSLGFSEGGGFDLKTARAVKNPRRVRYHLRPLWQAIKDDRWGAVDVAGHYLTDVIGKKSSLDGLDVALFQEGLGAGHVGGIVFGPPTNPGTGQISVGMDEKAGKFELTAAELPIQAVRIPSAGAEGETYTLVAKEGSVVGLRVAAEWDEPGGAADHLDIEFASLSLSDLEVAAGALSVGAAEVRFTELKLGGNLTVASKDEPKALTQLMDEIYRAVMAAVDLCYAAYVSILNGLLAMQGETVDANAVGHQIESILAERLGGDASLSLSWGALSVEGIVLNDGTRVDSVAVGAAELQLKAGARTCANLEILRMIQAAEDRGTGFTPEEVERIDQLAAIVTGPPEPGLDEYTLAQLGVELVRLDLSLAKAQAPHPSAQEAALQVVLTRKTNAEGEIEQQTVSSEGGFTVHLKLPAADAEGAVFEATADVADVQLPEGVSLDALGAVLGPVDLGGLSGSASVAEDGSLSLRVTLGSVEVGDTAYRAGGWTVSATGAASLTTVTLDMVVPGHPGAGLALDETQVHSLSIARLSADDLRLRQEGAFELGLTGGALTGLSLTSLDLGGFLEEPSFQQLRLEGARLVGLEAAVSGLLSMSGQQMSVGSIAVQGGEAGGYAFTAEDLAAKQIDVAASGHAVAFTDLRADGASGEVAEDGSVDATVEDIDATMVLDGVGIRVDNADVRLTVEGSAVALYTTIPALGMKSLHVDSEAFSLDTGTVTVPGAKAVVRIALTDGGVESITIARVEIPTLTIDGFAMHVPSKGVDVALPAGKPCTVRNFNVESLVVVPNSGSYLSWVREGEITVGTVHVAELAAGIVDKLQATTHLTTGPISATFSDGTVGFRVEDVQLSPEGEVLFGDGGVGMFQVSGASVGGVEGTVGEDGSAQVTLRDVHLGAGVYDDGNLHLEFQDVVADLVTVGGDQTAQTAFGYFQLQEALTGQPALTGKTVLSIQNVDLQGVSLDIDDIWELAGSSSSSAADPKAMIKTWFGTAQAAAAATSGRVEVFTSVGGVDKGLYLDIESGSLNGTVFGVPVPTARLYENSHSIAYLGLRYVSERGVRLSVLGMDFDVPLWQLSDEFEQGVPVEESGIDVPEWLNALDLKTHIDLAVAPTSLNLGGKGMLVLGLGEPALRLTADGSTNAGVDLGLDLSLMATRLQEVQGFTISTGAVTVEETIDLTLDFEGLLPKGIEAQIVRGRISQIQVGGEGE